MSMYDDYDYDIELMQPDEVIIIKVDTERYGIDSAKEIFEQVKEQFPNKKVILIPTGIDFQFFSIDNAIRYLESLK